MVDDSFSGKRDSDYRWLVSALAGQGGGKVRFQCTPSWGWSWALLAFILPHIFAFVFNIDFPSIFSRFRKGFGRPKLSKDRDFAIFFDMLVETLFLVEFC